MNYFSQSSLQDFADCRRRYYYRKILKYSWPDVLAQSVKEKEQRMLAGEQFHKMIHQYFLGVDIEDINSIEMSSIVRNWWKSFLNFKPALSGGEVFPEHVLTTNLSKRKLIAKYDLIFKVGDNYTIYDWKTTKSHPQKAELMDRLQTKIYMSTLAAEGPSYEFRNLVAPESIKMIYWFADHPQEEVEIGYSDLQFNSDRDHLSNLLDEIHSLKDLDEFPKTENIKMCAYCEFQTLCGRGGSNEGEEDTEMLITMTDELADEDALDTDSSFLLEPYA